MRASQARPPQLPPAPPILSSPPVSPPTQTPDETFQNLAWLCSSEAKGLQRVSTAHHIDPDSSVWLPRLFVTRDHPSGFAYCLLLHCLNTHTHTHTHICNTPSPNQAASFPLCTQHAAPPSHSCSCLDSLCEPHPHPRVHLVHAVHSQRSLPRRCL